MSMKIETYVRVNKNVRDANLAPKSVKLTYVKRIENIINGYFRKGGSPNGQWKAITYRDGQVLLDTGNLMRNVVGQVVGEDMQIINRASYAAIHNYGGKVQATQTVKQHTRRINQAFGKPIKARDITISQHQRNVNFTMPQREFMVLPKNAVEIFIQELENYSDWIKK